MFSKVSNGRTCIWGEEHFVGGNKTIPQSFSGVCFPAPVVGGGILVFETSLSFDKTAETRKGKKHWSQWFYLAALEVH